MAFAKSARSTASSVPCRASRYWSSWLRSSLRTLNGGGSWDIGARHTRLHWHQTGDKEAPCESASKSALHAIPARSVRSICHPHLFVASIVEASERWGVGSSPARLVRSGTEPGPTLDDVRSPCQVRVGRAARACSSDSKSTKGRLVPSPSLIQLAVGSRAVPVLGNDVLVDHRRAVFKTGVPVGAGLSWPRSTPQRMV